MQILQRYRRGIAEHVPDLPAWSVYLVLAGYFSITTVALIQRGGFAAPPSALVGALVVAAPMIWFVVTARISMAANALTLVGAALIMTTPAHPDFAPMIIVLTVIDWASMMSPKLSVPIALIGCAEIGAAAHFWHLEGMLIFGAAINFSWIAGYIMRDQIRRLHAERETQDERAANAAVEERNRIAREVHDVIAHSLSVTMLHLTAARRALEQDRDVDEAIDALTDAERLGRQAMSDIRRTVGLLGTGGSVGTSRPEPGLLEINDLVADVRRAGVDVQYYVEGDPGSISGTTGLGLYRITQESLANVLKHAPGASVSAAVEIGSAAVGLLVHNDLPTGVAAGDGHGSGLRGMRERAELLGGELDAGPDEHGWSVRAAFPIDPENTNWRALLSSRFCPKGLLNKLTP